MITLELRLGSEKTFDFVYASLIDERGRCRKCGVEGFRHNFQYPFFTSKAGTCEEVMAWEGGRPHDVARIMEVVILAAGKDAERWERERTVRHERIAKERDQLMLHSIFYYHGGGMSPQANAARDKALQLQKELDEDQR